MRRRTTEWMFLSGRPGNRPASSCRHKPIPPNGIWKATFAEQPPVWLVFSIRCIPAESQAYRLVYPTVETLMPKRLGGSPFGAAPPIFDPERKGVRKETDVTELVRLKVAPPSAMTTAPETCAAMPVFPCRFACCMYSKRSSSTRSVISLLLMPIMFVTLSMHAICRDGLIGMETCDRMNRYRGMNDS